jgi:fructose-bisphosphate aldolase class II
MKTLRECVQEAEEKKVAIGHFNISNMEALWGIWGAARLLDVPVIIGLSEGERAFFGIRQAKAVVQSLQDEFGYPIFLNADHSYSFERFKEAIDARFNAAIYDGAKLPIEQNIEQTKKCVLYARSVDPEIVVEGELGYIGTSSKLLDKLPEGVGPENMTKPEEAKRYVAETGVDLFAPAVGNIHGMLKNAPEPRLDIELIKAIRISSGVPLVLHGGSGTTPQDFKAAIAAGVSIVHINTEIRVAFRDAVKASLSEHPDEVAPYKLMRPAIEAIQKVVVEKLRIFNNY